jgi:dihydroorotase
MTGGSVRIAGARSERGLIDIVIEDGVIVWSGAAGETGHDGSGVTIDARGLLAIPGVIDPHVHMRDLGQSHKETWATGSAAALAGGVTTVFDMPNTVPATTDEAGLDAKRAAAGKTPIRRAFYFGAAPGKLKSVEKLIMSRPEDVAGIKLFMAGSSSNEVVDDPGEMTDYFALAARFGVVVAVHAEDQELIASAGRLVANPGPADHGRCRPREAAVRAAERAIAVAARTGARLYLCHVSTEEELHLIREAKQSVTLFCEVTPHHAFLDESIMARAGSLAKVNPPLRTPRDRESVVRALADGTADTVGSDHAPHTLPEKERTYSHAPSGFPGLETSIAVLTTLLRDQVFDITRLVDLTSRNAARIFALKSRGSLDTGALGDVTLIDLNRKWVVKSSEFRSKAHYSPFDGTTLTGRVCHTIVGGEIHRRSHG